MLKKIRDKVLAVDEKIKKIEAFIAGVFKNIFSDKTSITAKTICFLLFALPILFVSLLLFHITLAWYTNNILENILDLKGLNIGVVGDSLAVLSFIALIVAFVFLVKALKKQSEELELSREEMKLNRAEAKEANRLRTEGEVLENMKMLADRLDGKQR